MSDAELDRVAYRLRHGRRRADAPRPPRPSVRVAMAAVVAVLALGSPVVLGADTVDAASSDGRVLSGGLDRLSRAEVRAAYRDVLVPALATPVGWTGSVEGCVAGTQSAAAQQATLTAVNFYRNFVGLPPVTFDATYSAQAQQAALMMLAEGALSHDPGPDWACYTADGYTGASKSNLYLGRTGTIAIAGYMVDPGASNVKVGHRNWILDPQVAVMGSGSTSGSNALYVVSPYVTRPATPTWIAWPASGYFPAQLEPNGRWSVMGNGDDVDFTGATVTVTSAGSPVPVTIVNRDDSWYHPTIVWEFDPGFEPRDDDRTYTVSVQSVLVDGAPTSVTYDVTLFDADLAGPALFPDVQGDHDFYDDIAWMVGEGITDGYSDGLFWPLATVSRQGMASFLWRLEGEPALAGDPPVFSDVPPGHLMFDPIRWAILASVATGYDDGSFGPTRPVSRQAMAGFLWRLAGQPAPPPGAPTFPDVSPTSPFPDAISWMASEGITTGFGDGTFGPTQPVSRKSMAAFLHRYANRGA